VLPNRPAGVHERRLRQGSGRRFLGHRYQEQGPPGHRSPKGQAQGPGASVVWPHGTLTGPGALGNACDLKGSLPRCRSHRLLSGVNVTTQITPISRHIARFAYPSAIEASCATCPAAQRPRTVAKSFRPMRSICRFGSEPMRSSRRSGGEIMRYRSRRVPQVGRADETVWSCAIISSLEGVLAPGEFGPAPSSQWSWQDR